MEDNVVYPLLFKSSDEKVKNLAMKFSRKINIIGKVLANYKNTWPDAISIQTSPSLFILQTNELFDVLAARIKKEDDELYNL